MNDQESPQTELDEDDFSLAYAFSEIGEIKSKIDVINSVIEENNGRKERLTAEHNERLKKIRTEDKELYREISDLSKSLSRAYNSISVKIGQGEVTTGNNLRDHCLYKYKVEHERAYEKLSFIIDHFKGKKNIPILIEIGYDIGSRLEEHVEIYGIIGDPETSLEKENGLSMNLSSAVKSYLERNRKGLKYAVKFENGSKFPINLDDLALNLDDGEYSLSESAHTRIKTPDQMVKRWGFPKKYFKMSSDKYLLTPEQYVKKARVTNFFSNLL